VSDEELLVSVVVAVCADQRVRRLLDSLGNQSLSGYRFEVIVIENGSHELSDVDGRHGLVRYLHASQANSAAARNIGLRAARGRFLLLTDADCVVAPDWVQTMCDALSAGPLAAVGGPIQPYEPRTWVQRGAITIVDGQQTLNFLPAMPLPYVAGANAGFHTGLLREVGGFDEDLRSGNDVDICYKLGLHGHQIGLAPAAVVWHEDRATVGAHFHRFRFYAIYQVLLFAKYRNASGRTAVVDSYPFRRAWQAARTAPSAILGLLRGEAAPAQRAVLQLVEAVAVLAGELEGALRFRQLYL
jgi:GT2 family glycosyltransferase